MIELRSGPDRNDSGVNELLELIPRHLLATAIGAALLVAPSAAIADWNAGVSAYLRGDYLAAYREFKPLAEQGFAPAENFVGVLLEHGQGVQQNTGEALHWYQAAAAQGHDKAAYNLGVIYETGRGGVPVDFSQAVRWYRISADAGYPPGQTNLGYLYETGEGLPKDVNQAANWYRKAADEGYPIAEANLGFYYVNGTGVARDPVEAYFWLRLSLQQAHLAPRDPLTAEDKGSIAWEAATVEQELSREQRNSVEKRLTDWRPTGNYRLDEAPMP